MRFWPYGQQGQLLWANDMAMFQSDCDVLTEQQVLFPTLASVSSVWVDRQFRKCYATQQASTVW